MIDVKNILAQARRKGACKLAKGDYNAKQLAALLFSPQGREFCFKAGFPTLSMWRNMAKGADMADYGIYIDSADVSLSNGINYCLVGKTQAECVFEGVFAAHCVLAMHGAKVKIKASNYAVVVVSATKDCEIEIEKDERSIVMHEYGTTLY